MARDRRVFMTSDEYRCYTNMEEAVFDIFPINYSLSSARRYALLSYSPNLFERSREGRKKEEK